MNPDWLKDDYIFTEEDLDLIESRWILQGFNMSDLRVQRAMLTMTEALSGMGLMDIPTFELTVYLAYRGHPDLRNPEVETPPAPERS